jgi:glycosyltransferase involved in cell wall biosynthesis
MTRLAVVAPGDPLDVGTWSGTPFHATLALRAHYADLIAVRSPRPGWVDFARRAAKRLSRGRLDMYWSPSLAKYHAATLLKRLRAQGADTVICIGNAPLSAFIAGHMRTIHVSDATVPLMRSYYREFSDLTPGLASSANELDKRSVRLSKACLFANDWAAQSAIDDYGADPARMHVIPLGANFEPDCPVSDDSVVDMDVCNLVFVGMDWKRKGGDIAVRIVQALHRRGMKVRLDIVGANPALTADPSLIRVHGYVSKGNPEGRALFASIMERASFVLVPTRQECAGMFAPEANAFGIPVISTRTGGLDGTVTDGVNGYLLPLDAGPDAYADRILSIWSDPVRYAALRRSSLAQYRSLLNWRSWGEAASEVIEQVAEGK